MEDRKQTSVNFDDIPKIIEAGDKFKVEDGVIAGVEKAQAAQAEQAAAPGAAAEKSTARPAQDNEAEMTPEEHAAAMAEILQAARKKVDATKDLLVQALMRQAGQTATRSFFGKKTRAREIMQIVLDAYCLGFQVGEIQKARHAAPNGPGREA